MDVVGTCGFDVEGMSSIMNPFSISSKLSPALLSSYSCKGDDAIPNKLEWFCFPSRFFFAKVI